VTVTWERPDYPNGIISGYRVTVGYYESGRGQINTTDTINTTLSATIQHSSLGECPSEDSMHAPLIPVVLHVGMCSLSSILTLSFQSLVFPTMGVWWPSTRWGRARDGRSCSTPENSVRGCVQFELFSLHWPSQLLLVQPLALCRWWVALCAPAVGTLSQ